MERDSRNAALVVNISRSVESRSGKVEESQIEGEEEKVGGGAVRIMEARMGIQSGGKVDLSALAIKLAFFTVIVRETK